MSTLEKHFIDTFGIYIQIFRKSGNSWLQTTATDEWTLTQQNNKGEEMSRDIEQVEEENDIHEQP